MHSVAIVARGDVMSPVTWSATPRNIANAFSELGWSVTPIDASDDRLSSRISAQARAMGRFRFRSQPYGYLESSRRKRSEHRLAEDLQRVEPDLVLFTDIMAIGPQAPRPFASVLYTDSCLADFARGWNLDRRSRALYEAVARDAYRSFDVVFTTSSWAARRIEDFASLPAGSAVAVGSGGASAPTTPWCAARYASGRTLFVAKVRLEHKGFLELIEGFRLARTVDPRLTLDVVVPSDTTVPRVAGLTKHSNLPRAALQRLYQECALFAMPAPCEPWGLVYIEAASAGTPFLASSSMGVGDIAEQTGGGILVDGADPVLICDALLSSHADPDNLARLGENGRRNVEHFTWRGTIGRLTSGLVDRGMLISTCN